MIAAIYARKSTEQNGVADEQKSVAGRSSTHASTRRARAGRSPTSMSMSMTESPARSLPTVPGFSG